MFDDQRITQYITQLYRVVKQDMKIAYKIGRIVQVCQEYDGPAID